MSERRPGSECESLTLGNTELGRARQDGTNQPGLESKTRVDKADPAAGASACHQACPLVPYHPPILTPRTWPGPFKVYRPCRWRRNGHLGPGDPLGSRGVQVPVWDREKEPQRLSSCKVVTHRPPVTRHGLLDRATAGTPTPVLSVCQLLCKFRDTLSPALASAQQEQEPPGLQASPLLCSSRQTTPSRAGEGPICPKLGVTLNLSSHWWGSDP